MKGEADETDDETGVRNNRGNGTIHWETMSFRRRLPVSSQEADLARRQNGKPCLRLFRAGRRLFCL